MTTRWPARFVVLMAAIGIAVLAAPPDAHAQRAKAKRLAQMNKLAKAMINKNAMKFVIVSGGPNSCGPSCDTWISAEGSFDDEAYERFRKVVESAGTKNLPVFFHSPGGVIGQAVRIGALLHDRNMRAGVAQSVALRCDRRSRAGCDASGKPQWQLKLNATCGSACVLALIGARRREVPLQATLRVHTPLGYDMSGKAKQDEFVAVINGYTAATGISTELTKVTLSVPFERGRTITREEMVRFGIDRRDTSKPRWKPDTTGPSAVAMIRFPFRGWAPGFNNASLKLSCRPNGSVELEYAAEGQVGDTQTGGVVLAFGSERIGLTLVSRSSAQGHERRAATLTPDLAIKLAASEMLSMVDTSAANAKPVPVGGTGLAEAMAPVLHKCPVPAVAEPEGKSVERLPDMKEGEAAPAVAAFPGSQ